MATARSATTDSPPSLAVAPVDMAGARSEPVARRAAKGADGSGSSGWTCSTWESPVEIAVSLASMVIALLPVASPVLAWTTGLSPTATIAPWAAITMWSPLALIVRLPLEDCTNVCGGVAAGAALRGLDGRADVGGAARSARRTGSRRGVGGGGRWSTTGLTVGGSHAVGVTLGAVDGMLLTTVR